MTKLWIVIFSFIGILSLNASDNGLVGNWPLNEGDGVVIKDVSGNNNNGKILHKMRGIKWVDGHNGKGLLFDGTGKRGSFGAVIIPKMGKYDFSKGITVESWIKLSSTMKRNGVYEIVSNTKGESGPGFRFIIHWSRLLFASGDGKKMFCAVTTAAKFPIKANIWYHVAGTYDGSTFKVYIDGVKAAESKPDQKFTKGGNNIFIGSYNSGYAYSFDGIINSVKIYTRVLSALEIAKQAKGL